MLIDILLTFTAITDVVHGGWGTKIVPSIIKELPSWHTKTLISTEVSENKSSPRGLSNSKYIKINTRQIDTPAELSYIVIHEVGHTVDIGTLRGTSKKTTSFFDDTTPIVSDDPSVVFYNYSWKDSDTKKKDARDRDFISGYGMTNVFEDFAESYVMYRTHGDTFRCMALKSRVLDKKYTYMYYLFGKKHFQTESVVEECEQVSDPSLMDK